MRFTIIIIILGFINSLLMGQSPCDTSGGFFVFLTNPPKADLPDNILEEKLNQALSFNLEGLNNVDYIYMIYFVNCKGDDFKYMVGKLVDGKTIIDSTSMFSKRIVDFFKTTIEFSPGYLVRIKAGKEEKEMVDYQGSYIIHLENQKFHILNDKEAKKHQKIKRKNK